MSHATVQFAPAGNSVLTRLGRPAMVIAVLVATIGVGAVMSGCDSQAAAASRVGTAKPDTALQLAAFSSTDLSVPQASAVFSRQERAPEEDCSTF